MVLRYGVYIDINTYTHKHLERIRLEFWDFLWLYLLVFLLAATPFVELFVVIPVATVAGLHILPVTILAFTGNLITVLLVILFVNQIKAWLSRKNRKESKRFARARKFWDTFGLPGLALVGPGFVGSHLSALISLTFGGTKGRTTFWMVISLTVWCVGITALTYLGVDFIGLNQQEDHWILTLF